MKYNNKVLTADAHWLALTRGTCP